MGIKKSEQFENIAFEKTVVLHSNLFQACAFFQLHVNYIFEVFYTPGDITDYQVDFIHRPVLDRRPKFYGRSQRFKTYGYGGQRSYL